MYRAPSVSSFVLALLLTTHAARAGESDEKRVCLSTYVEAQAARQEGKLRASKEALVQCGRSTCPMLIRNDCVQWLREVTEATPTVVLSATGPDGRDRSDVRVSLDGRPLAARLDGRPIAIDPGEHVFLFTLDDGTSVETRLVLREAEHYRAVTGTFPRAAVSSGDAARSTPRGDEVPATTRPVPATTWIFGGVAASALIVSATFAGLAWFGDPGWVSSQACRPSCSRSDVDLVRQRFAVADVAGAVGLVSAGAASYFYFTRPRRDRPAPPLSLTVAPRIVAVGVSGEF